MARRILFGHARRPLRCVWQVPAGCSNSRSGRSSWGAPSAARLPRNRPTATGGTRNGGKPMDDWSELSNTEKLERLREMLIQIGQDLRRMEQNQFNAVERLNQRFREMEKRLDRIAPKE